MRDDRRQIGQGAMGFAVLLAVLMGACREVAPPPTARKLKALIAERLPPVQMEKLPEAQRRFPEAAVYVDGKPVGVIKHSELPPALKPQKKQLANGRTVNRWSLLDYLRSLGVNVDKIRAVHLIGGRGRVVIVDGEELRKHRDTLLFSFTRGSSGKARMHWPPDGIKVNTTIDLVSAVTAYIDKAPPLYNQKELELTFEDGKPIEGIPYAAPEEALKGTRVYVDGVLAGAMKRKVLPNSMLMPGSDEAKPTFSLAAWLASFGVDTASVRAVELLAGENVVTRLTSKEWEGEKRTLSFTLPRRSQGKILIHLPPDDPAVKASAVDDPRLKVSAVIIYKNVTALDRPMTPLAALVARDQAGSSAPQGGEGSDSDQDGENAGSGDGSGSARRMQRGQDSDQPE